MTIKQLDFFEDTKKNGKSELKPIDYASPIGMYKEIAHVKGVKDLSDKALEMLHYLYLNHAKEEDGFIPAKKLASLLGYYDTREIRKLMAEIDDKTELVVYSSQYGYKLASSNREIDLAVRFALAPALTTIKRVIAKSKNESKAKMLQGYIGNIEKLYGGHVNGQLQYDDELETHEINHYPEQTFIENMQTIDERIAQYETNKKDK